MYIVTNRELKSKAKSHFRFGGGFNAAGPDELRLAEALYKNGTWTIKVLGDTVTRQRKKMFASEASFVTLQNRMRKSNRNCLFFVHGFNNDLKDVLERCRGFEENYDVEVIAFTWPADGRKTGTVKYKSDKRDAVRSVVALDRTLEKLSKYFSKYSKETEQCGQRVSLMMHSMGNYLFKHLMKSSVYQGETSLFDNVIMAAADVNNQAHAEWVDRIAYRRRLYVTINEDDKALRASRMKTGEKQKARLGHFTQNLYSRNAVYIDVTNAEGVKDSHSYFEGRPIHRNPGLGDLFSKMINGLRVEDDLPYDTHSRTYQVR